MNAVQTPEEVVAEARELLNDRVREMQTERGITKHSDLSIAAATDVIRSLENLPTKFERAAGDRELMAMANWHPACLLTQYKDPQSAEYQRDLQQYGVYVIFELTPNGYEPRFIEALPRYVGMSSILSSRLKQHATGRSSTPAYRVMADYLLQYCSDREREAYNTAARREQQELRELVMDRRRLWVRTTHTASKREADLLERAMVRLYESQGIELWNHIKFATTPPFKHVG